MSNPLDSNSLSTVIHAVCWECGVTANVLTCLKKYGQPPKQAAYQVSTYHKGRCDVCGEKKSVTQTRDFFYPDFALIDETVRLLRNRRLAYLNKMTPPETKEYDRSPRKPKVSPENRKSGGKGKR